MLKILKNKVFLGAMCLALAGVLSFVLLPKLSGSENAELKATITELRDEIKAIEENREEAEKSEMVTLALEMPTTSAGLAGSLRSNVKIDIYKVSQDGDFPSSEKIMDSVTVLEVRNKELANVQTLVSVEGEDVDIIPVFAVVKVTSEQAELLIAYEDHLHFVLGVD